MYRVGARTDCPLFSRGRSTGTRPTLATPRAREPSMQIELVGRQETEGTTCGGGAAPSQKSREKDT